MYTWDMRGSFQLRWPPALIHARHPFHHPDAVRAGAELVPNRSVNDDDAFDCLTVMRKH